MHIVITGTSRASGIGVEFVRQYLERGDHVDAGVRRPENAEALSDLANRHPGRLRVFPCDTTNDASVRAFADAIGDVPVDILINNAAISGAMTGFFSADLEEAQRIYDTNTLGTVRVMRALMPHLRRSSVRKIVNISSNVASIGETTTEMFFGYRMSKAAINMATKVASEMLKVEGFTLLAVHPGWVKTDMGGPRAPTTPEESVRGMITQIDLRGPAESGTFFDFTGKTLAW